MSKDLMIFDCDGVLISSERIASACLLDALGEAGIQSNHEEVFCLFTGLGQEDTAALIRQKWGYDDYPRIAARVRETMFNRFRRELTPMPGMDALLSRFQDVPKCVASNSRLDRLKSSLGLLEIHSHFAGHVYSAEQVARGKPAPDLVEFCLSRMGCRSENALMVDDSSHGIEAAVAAGVMAIGFVDPADPRAGRIEALRAAGASHVATGCEELAKMLEALIAAPTASKM